MSQVRDLKLTSSCASPRLQRYNAFFQQTTNGKKVDNTLNTNKFTFPQNPNLIIFSVTICTRPDEPCQRRIFPSAATICTAELICSTISMDNSRPLHTRTTGRVPA